METLAWQRYKIFTNTYHRYLKLQVILLQNFNEYKYIIKVEMRDSCKDPYYLSSQEVWPLSLYRMRVGKRELEV